MSGLVLRSAANTGRVPENRPFLLYLLAEVAADAAGAGVKMPVNLNLVLDTSDSMKLRVASEEQLKELARMGMVKEVMVDGVPAWDASSIPEAVLKKLPMRIEMVKEALKVVVEQLGPEDYFSLVVFAGKAEVLVPNTSGREEARLLRAVNELDKLRLGDETFVGKGLALGLAEAKKRMQPGIATRVLVLTDGFTQDEAECLRQMEVAKRERVPISTMGLLGTFNEELLIPMADGSGGHAHYVQELGELPAAFAEEWESVQTVAGRNLDIKVQVTSGVEVRRTYRVKPELADMGELEGYGGSYTLLLGDAELKNPPAVLFEFVLPPRPAGKYRVAQLLLSYDDHTGSKVRGDRVDVVAEYTAEPVSHGDFAPRVMSFVERVTAHRLQSDAIKAMEEGDVMNATMKLKAAATRLLDMGELELARTVEEQADEMASQGSMDDSATKKLRYETRRLTKKLG